MPPHRTRRLVAGNKQGQISSVKLQFIEADSNKKKDNKASEYPTSANRGLTNEQRDAPELLEHGEKRLKEVKHVLCHVLLILQQQSTVGRHGERKYIIPAHLSTFIGPALFAGLEKPVPMGCSRYSTCACSFHENGLRSKKYGRSSPPVHGETDEQGIVDGLNMRRKQYEFRLYI